MLEVEGAERSSPRSDVSRREGDRDGDRVDPVEAALADALTKAAAAERWDVVAQLARELEARRLTRAANVVVLSRARADRSQ